MGRWQLLYRAEDIEFTRFCMPQIKRLQRLIYMSVARPQARRDFRRNDDAKLHIFSHSAKKNIKINYLPSTNHQTIKINYLLSRVW